MANGQQFPPSLAKGFAALIDRARRLEPRLQLLQIAGRLNQEDAARVQHMIASFEAVIDHIERVNSGAT